MKLRMLVPLGGTHDNKPWPGVGGIVDITHPGTVDDLVRNHYAELVPEPPVVETAAVTPPQNAAKRVSKPKPREGSRKRTFSSPKE